jgi:hypothetical protein
MIALLKIPPELPTGALRFVLFSLASSSAMKSARADG